MQNEQSVLGLNSVFMLLCNDWTAWTAHTRGKNGIMGWGMGWGGWRSRGHRLIRVQLKMTLCAGEVYITLKAHTTLSVNFAQCSGVYRKEKEQKKRENEWEECDMNTSCMWKYCLRRVIFKVDASGLCGYMNLCWVCSSLMMFALKAVQ